MDIQCPLCMENEVKAQGMVYKCDGGSYNSETKETEGCDFKVWKKMFGAELTEQDVSDLCDAKEIEKTCVSKAGKNYQGLLRLELPECTIKLSFKDNNSEKDTNGISEFAKGYNKDGKTVWKLVAGATITKEEALIIFNGGEVTREDFQKRDNGGDFKATLIMNDEGKVIFKPREA